MDRAADIVTRAQRAGAEAEARDRASGFPESTARATYWHAAAGYLEIAVKDLCDEVAIAKDGVGRFADTRVWDVKQTGGMGFEVVGDRGFRIAHTYNRYHAELLACGPAALAVLQKFIDAAPDKGSELVRAARAVMVGPLMAKGLLDQHAREVAAAAPKVAEAA